MTPHQAREALDLARSGASTRRIQKAIGGPYTRAWALAYVARLERTAAPSTSPAPAAELEQAVEPPPPPVVEPEPEPTPAARESDHMKAMRTDPAYRAEYRVNMIRHGLIAHYEAECARLGVPS